MGLFEYLNLAFLWYWIPKGLRHGLGVAIICVPILSVMFGLYALALPDTLPDGVQNAMHLAPPDWFETSGRSAWTDWFRPEDANDRWSPQGARHPLGSPGYLDVAGITTPELTANKRRDTLYQFSAHILIDPNGQDAISWVVRFSDNPLRFSRSHGRWSGYLFRIQGLSVHKPTVTFYSCGLFRRCEPLAGPVPLINQDVYHANELQVDIQGADSRFTLKGQLTGKDKDEGGEPSVALIDLSEVPFVDPDRRYLWGNVAFLNLNSNLEPVQGRGFKLTQIEIRLKPIVARHGATP